MTKPTTRNIRRNQSIRDKRKAGSRQRLNPKRNAIKQARAAWKE